MIRTWRLILSSDIGGDRSDTGVFKLADTVWFLDRYGKSRWGVIRRLDVTPAGVPYAEIFDEIDKRMANLALDVLSKSPIDDAPKARTRRSIKKKGHGRSK
jgi:hypothetical protein